MRTNGDHMYVVVTTVNVEAGSIDELADLFDATNRELVAGHPDWLAAYFTADRENSQVTVIAHWDHADSYAELRSSEAFQTTMAKFSRRFVGPPTVSINEVLVSM